MRSSSAGLARPVRTEPNLPRVASTDLSMCSRASSRSSSIMALSPHQGPHSLAGNYPIDVALGVHVEDADRHVVVHAERQRRRVHDLEPALQRLAVGEIGKELRVGVLLGVGGVGALHPGLGHQQDLGVDLVRAQGGSRVGGEERVAGAGREDHDALLLEVAHGAPADVGLGHLRDVDGRLHPRVHALVLERVLEGQRVEHRGEHAHVVRGGALHPRRRAGQPSVDVARAYDDRDLDAAVVDLADLARDRLHALEVGAVGEVAHERLPRQLQQHSPEGGLRHAPTWNFANRRMTTFSPVWPASSARICSIVLPSCLSPLTCGWLRSTTSSIHLRSLPSAILARTFSGLSAACCSNTRSSACLASSGMSCSETYWTWGEAATWRATSRAKAMKSSLRATKSVLQSTSTSTPVLPLVWM